MSPVATSARRRYITCMTQPTPDAPLDLLTAVTPLGDGRYEAQVPDGWQQGRGAFGGLVTATLVRAMEAATPGRPLRSLTAELCGPTQPGRAELRVETLREGSAVTTVAARLVQGAEVQAHAVGVLGKERLKDFDGTHLEAPTRPDWRKMERLPIEPPFGPDFARYWDFRTTSLPFTGQTDGHDASGWIRPLAPGVKRDAAFLAACIDAWWPTFFARTSTLRPMATIAFTFQPVGHFEGLDPAAPLFHRARLVAADGGYGVEFRELWGEDGRLLALNQQTIVVIK